MPKITLDPGPNLGDLDAQEGLAERFSRVVIDEFDESTGLARHDTGAEGDGLEDEEVRVSGYRGRSTSRGDYDFDEDESDSSAMGTSEMDGREDSENDGYEGAREDDLEFKSMFNERIKLPADLFDNEANGSTVAMGQPDQRQHSRGDAGASEEQYDGTFYLMGKEHGVWKSDFDPAKNFTTKRFKNSDTVLRSDLFGNPVPPKRTSASGLEPSASPYKLEIEADIVEVDYGIGIGRPEELPWRITLEGTKPIDYSPGSARPLLIAHGLGENHIFDEAAKRGDALEPSFIDYWRDVEGHDDDELKEEEKYDGEEGSIASSEFLTASEHASEADSESAYESPSDFEDDDATYKLAIEVGDLDLYGMNAKSQGPWAIELEGKSRFSAECTKVPASSSHHVAGDAAIPVPDDEQNDSVWEPTKFLYCDFDFTFQPAFVPEQLRPKSFNATPTFFGIRQRADAKTSQICFTFTPAVNRPRSFSKNPALPGIQQDGPLWERAYVDASQTLFTFHPPTVVTPLRETALHFSGDADLIKYAKAHPGKIYDRLLAGLQPGKYDRVENPFEVRSPRSWKVPLVLPESGKSRELTVMVSSDSRNLVARGIAREL